MKYNLNKLNELSGGDIEFNASIIETFLSETPDDIENLKKAIAGKEFDHIYQFAHKIKPNAELLGMEEIREQMLTIEGHARGDRDMSAIEKIFSEAEEELNTAFEEFRNYLK